MSSCHLINVRLIHDNHSDQMQCGWHNDVSVMNDVYFCCYCDREETAFLVWSLSGADKTVPGSQMDRFIRQFTFFLGDIVPTGRQNHKLKVEIRREQMSAVMLL